MTDGTEKPKIPSKFAKRIVRYNEFRCKGRLGDRRIKELLNSVLAKYRDLSVSRRSIICRNRRDLLATVKSLYFAQPRPIIVNCLT